MIPSTQLIHTQLSELRRVINTTNDPIVKRVTYAMEYGLQWGQLEAHGADMPVEHARFVAKWLKEELCAK